MSAKKTGAPPRPKYNVRLSDDEVLDELSKFPVGDPFRELLTDGKGMDFRLPSPPWSDYTIEEMTINRARLRVDPKSTNHIAQTWSAVALAIAGEEDFRSGIGEYFNDLLRDWDEKTVGEHFKDILRMKRNAEDPPHKNYLAYKAYCDFLEEFGFDPTMARLSRFIKDDPQKYPVGISEPPGDKTWWQMYFEAGLVRLAE